MNKRETAQILTVLKVAYPGFYSKLTKSDVENMVNVWADLFQDDDFLIVQAAVKAVINAGTKDGYPPDIGRIKEEMRRFAQPETDTAMEAWNQVKKAISYYNSRTNFSRLPELSQKIVGSANQLREWALMDPAEINTVVQSNFLRAYRAKESAFLAQQALPADVKQLIAGLQERMMLNGADSKEDVVKAEIESGQAGQIASTGHDAGDQTERTGSGVSHPGQVS